MIFKVLHGRFCTVMLISGPHTMTFGRYWVWLHFSLTSTLTLTLRFRPLRSKASCLFLSHDLWIWRLWIFQDMPAPDFEPRHMFCSTAVLTYRHLALPYFGESCTSQIALNFVERFLNHNLLIYWSNKCSDI